MGGQKKPRQERREGRESSELVMGEEARDLRVRGLMV